MLTPVAARAASDYETPEYSGPSAHTNGGMQSPAAPHVTPGGPIDAQAYDRARVNGDPVQKFTERRNAQIQNEMQRRRDEVYRRIKTNE